MITLSQVQAAILDYARQQDASESILAHRVNVAADTLKSYVPADALNPRDTAEFKNAAESVKVQLREVYLESQRYTGRDRSGVVNMVLAKQVVETPEADREKWAKDSTERKIWDAMLAYCRNIWRDIADEAFPKPETGGASTKSEKKAPTPDALLAGIDAWLATKPDQALVNNFFDQVSKRALADVGKRKTTK